MMEGIKITAPEDGAVILQLPFEDEQIGNHDDRNTELFV